MLKPIDQELDDYTCARMTITEADCKNLIAYARKYKKPESPVIYYISVNSAEAYKNRLPVRGVYNQGVTEQGNRRVVSHDVWKTPSSLKHTKTGKWSASPWWGRIPGIIPPPRFPIRKVLRGLKPFPGTAGGRWCTANALPNESLRG